MNVTKRSDRDLKTLDLDGYKIHYVDVGEGEPVVLVHGGISDFRIWESQLDAFAAEHRVIAISRRFAYPNDQTISDPNECAAGAHARDLIGFLQKLDPGPVHLIGHSFGGFISIMAALERPDLLKSLTLLEPPASSVVAGMPEADRLWAEFINQVMVPAGKAFVEGKDEEAVACFIGGVMADPSYYESAPQPDRNMWLANTPELKVVVSGADLFPRLSCLDLEGFEIPVLLIKGEQSPGFIRLISDQLHRCIPNSELKELPNASHGLQHQNPAGFNKMVLEFIDTL